MNPDEFCGYISRQHTIWCGACGQWDQKDEPQLKRFKALARSQGWVFTRKEGWRCRSCVRKVKESNSGS